MNMQKKLFWHQGLLLTPHHLQYSDLQHQQNSYLLQQSSAPFCWGVVSLDVNEKALANDVCELSVAKLLFDDGTLACFPGNAVLPSRSFTPAWSNRREPFTVYVGIRKLDGERANVTVTAAGDDLQQIDTRFCSGSEDGNVPDLYQDGPDAPVKTLTHVLRLFWENEVENAENYQLLPVMQLISDGGEVKMSTYFIPPSLHLSSSPALLRQIRGVRDELASRIAQLEDYKTPLAGGLTDLDVTSIPYRLALQLLCNFAPMFFHYTDSPVIHPWHVYGYLRQMVGGLSTLNINVNFQGAQSGGGDALPPYNHSNLGSCFSEALALILKLLNEVTMGAETFIPMTEIESGLFKADIPADLIQSTAFYLALRTETPVEEMIASCLNFAKIGSSEKIRSYVEYSLPGLGVKHLAIHPEGLPRRPNFTYFRLLQDGDSWQNIQLEKTIALFWDDAPSDLRAEIVVLRR